MDVKTIIIGEKEMKLNFRYKNKWGFFSPNTRLVGEIGK